MGDITAPDWKVLAATGTEPDAEISQLLDGLYENGPCTAAAVCPKPGRSSSAVAAAISCRASSSSPSSSGQVPLLSAPPVIQAGPKCVTSQAKHASLRQARIAADAAPRLRLASGLPIGGSDQLAPGCLDGTQTSAMIGPRRVRPARLLRSPRRVSRCRLGGCVRPDLRSGCCDAGDLAHSSVRSGRPERLGERVGGRGLTARGRVLHEATSGGLGARDRAAYEARPPPHGTGQKWFGLHQLGAAVGAGRRVISGRGFKRRAGASPTSAARSV
jgi:hypothetical protein